MTRTNKISNLKRLDFKNKYLVLLYLLKTILKIKTGKERDTYLYYNGLIHCDGQLIKETENAYISDYSGTLKKRIRLRKKPSSDMDVFQQVYKDNEYLAVVKAYQANFINPKNYKLNIIDAGSNIGLTSLFFSEHFNHPNIVSIEPEDNNFEAIQFNLGQLPNKISMIKGAVWSSDTHIKIVNDFNDRQDWGYRVDETTDADGLPAYSLNSLAKTHHFDIIDILKIDIEGSEKQIFNPAVANLDFLAKTRCIAIEIHDEYNCRTDIYQVLKDFGYEFFESGELTVGINLNLKNNLKPAGNEAELA